jgi:hypothetical protein
MQYIEITPRLFLARNNNLAHHYTFAVRLDKGVEWPSLQQQRLSPRRMHHSCLPLPQAPFPYPQ